MQRVDRRRGFAARACRTRRAVHRSARRSTCGWALLLSLLPAVFASPPAAAATPAIAWSAARIGRLRAHVAFAVRRPTIAATITLPVRGTVAGALPVAALQAAEAGISGSVGISGDTRTVRQPAELLRAQALPGALALTYGEQRIELPPRGDATITLRLGGGAAPQTRRIAFSVRPGAPLSPPPPTPEQAEFVRELNAFRAAAGVPPVRLSAALTAAARAHAAFVSAHPHLYRGDVSVHDEPVAWDRIAGWSGHYSGNRDQAFGSATGGGSEVMSSGNPDPVAFLVWETVFHRNIILSPSVLAAGAADVGGQFVMDLSSPGGVAAPNQIWPPPSDRNVPTTFGGEWPSPLAPFAGAHFPVGTPLTWRDYGATAGTVVGAPRFTLTAEPSGAAVPARLLSPRNWTARRAASTGVPLGTALALIPDAPLKPHTDYVARVSGTLTVPGHGTTTFERTWRFTTGSEVVPPPSGFTRPVLPRSSASTLLARPLTPAASPPSGTTSTGTTSAGTTSTGTTSTGTAPRTGRTQRPPTAAGRTPRSTGHSAPGTTSGATPPAPGTPAAVTRRLATLRSHIAHLAKPSFTDLWKARWAASAIRALAAAGVIHGIGSHMFDPLGTLTRAQMAVALSNLVPSSRRVAVAGPLPAWAVPAVRQVAAEGWMGAPGATFRPQQRVSRSAAIQALTRMMGWSAHARRYAASGAAWPKAVAPPDVRAGQTRDDLLWAVHVQLLQGIDGHIAPQANLTRAQFAVLLYRLVQRRPS